ncbi:MmcQ/YjbR family DNA-binding protein [Rhodococcus sp. 24CO]|uniref:MmcQ/YjbR family DNA-binding protein n=1 Tax=Rhodococcus sp. 24CO TaxID=3117460 RepID=UPI003D33778D
MADNMRRLEEISLSLPEAQRVDIEAWDGHPTFRVRGKNFVFCNGDATSVTIKLSKPEAEAVVATEPRATAAGYGLGRHGWVTLDLSGKIEGEYWDQLEEWIYTSFTLVAPKKLARIVLDGDAHGGNPIDS